MYKLLAMLLLSSCAVYQVKNTDHQNQEETVVVKIEFDGNGKGLVDVGAANSYCIKDCVVNVPKGKLIDIHPTAEHGSKFLGFSGDCYGNTCKVDTKKELEVFVTFGDGMDRSLSSINN